MTTGLRFRAATSPEHSAQWSRSPLPTEPYRRSELAQRWCQTNANQSLFSSDLNSLGRAETAPLGESSGTAQLEI
jgi:hypothetical protein